MSTEKHYCAPCKGKPRNEQHLLMCCDADESQPVLQLTGCCVVMASTAATEMERASNFHSAGAGAVEAALDAATKLPGSTTVWLWRGWEDLVLSGLAELIDKGALTYRSAVLDGQRVLIRGLWRGRKITITSISNWLGQWHRPVDDSDYDEDVVRAVGRALADYPANLKCRIGTVRRVMLAWQSIAQASHALGLPGIEPTVAAAARLLWRRWLGPRLLVDRKAPHALKSRRDKSAMEIVVPSPYRPDRARLAERHVCYGLYVRQLRRGFVDEPIYCLDLRAAYAMALAQIPLPAYYCRTLRAPSVEKLGSETASGTGLALVRIEATDYPYPARRNGRTMPALGNYWTWLAGSELAEAIITGAFRECHTAYVWKAARVSRKAGALLAGLGPELERLSMPSTAALWRALYSSLVGQFAGRHREWKDIPRNPGIDRWCQWFKADKDSGKIRTCRSIAGRQQQLVDLEDSPASVPIVYACITAHVRSIVRSLLAVCGPENAVAVVADSIWVTATGWQNWQRESSAQGFAPDSLCCKEIWDRGWFTGKSMCVLERKNVRYLRAPGCPNHVCLDGQGVYERVVAVPWCESASVAACDGAARRKQRFPAARVVERCGEPAVPLPLGETLDDLLLPVELLQPAKHERTIEDV